MFRLARRLLRRIIRPISRPAALFLAWTHRYTVGLWWRSLEHEARHQIEHRQFDPTRVRHLMTALWRVSSDARLANAPELRRLSLDEVGVIVDAEQTWRSRTLLDTRLGL